MERIVKLNDLQVTALQRACLDRMKVIEIEIDLCERMLKQINSLNEE